MDAGDVSLSIRRARRAGAKHLDLSDRGLQAWPEDLFALRQLQSLDISGNDLKNVDDRISQLENLEELNLASNRFQSLADLKLDGLPNLQSLVLEGNPVASSVPATTLRQLAKPVRKPGQTPAQVILELLAGSKSEAKSSGGSRRSTATVEAITSIDEVTSVEGFGPEPIRGNARKAGSTQDLDKILAGDDESAAPWRKEQKIMVKEIETLRARVNELEAEAEAKAGENSANVDSSVPAWLRQDSKTSMSNTLPSRRGSLLSEGANDDLKQQLATEQRKCKRLEREVTRLSERMNESGGVRAGSGSVPHFDFSDVELEDILNQGGFSVVHKGCWHTTHVAIKKLFDPNINEELLAEFDNEVQKLEMLRHPNILMLLAVHRKPPALSMITELVEGGSFFQLLHTPMKFNYASKDMNATPKQIMDILDTTGVAIAFCHARGIVHRDIKSHNVLLSPNLDVKLCDFGLARMRSELMTGAMQFAGTPNYMAPEIFKNKKYTEKVDVFAYGTMLWEAMAVDIPFANFDPADIRERVIEGRMPQMPNGITSSVRSLIQACWTLDQVSRPTMAIVVTQLRDCHHGSASTGASRRPHSAMPGTAKQDSFGPTLLNGNGMEGTQRLHGTLSGGF